VARVHGLVPRHDRDDVREAPRRRRHRLQLALVAAQDDARLRVLEQVADLLRGLLRVDAERHRAEQLRREILRQPARLGRPDDGDPIAAPQPEPAQPAREHRGVLVQLAPARRAPRPAGRRVALDLVEEGRSIRVLLGAQPQQVEQRAGGRRNRSGRDVRGAGLQHHEPPQSMTGRGRPEDNRPGGRQQDRCILSRNQQSRAPVCTRSARGRGV
jgi:hypothetical protein